MVVVVRASKVVFDFVQKNSPSFTMYWILGNIWSLTLARAAVCRNIHKIQQTHTRRNY